MITVFFFFDIFHNRISRERIITPKFTEILYLHFELSRSRDSLIYFSLGNVDVLARERPATASRRLSLRGSLGRVSICAATSHLHWARERYTQGEVNGDIIMPCSNRQTKKKTVSRSIASTRVVYFRLFFFLYRKNTEFSQNFFYYTIRIRDVEKLQDTGYFWLLS